MTWEAFKQAACLEEPEQVPVGLIVDSPWLPGYAGIDTRDYYLLPDRWYAINKGLLERFPEATWVPGFWVEYGMAAEPSGFGVKLHFYDNRPPAIEPVIRDIAAWGNASPADPNEHGLMPLVLRLYALAEERLHADGLGIRMVCARGPMAVAAFVMGITPLMMGIVKNPQVATRVLEMMTPANQQVALSAFHMAFAASIVFGLLGIAFASRIHDEDAASTMARGPRQKAVETAGRDERPQKPPDFS